MVKNPLIAPDLQNLGEDATVLSGRADPTAGGGVRAELGSLYSRLSSPPEVYQKIGPTNTDWQMLGGSGGSLQIAIGSGVGLVIPATIESSALTLEGGESVQIEASIELDVATLGTTTFTVSPTRDGAIQGTTAYRTRVRDVQKLMTFQQVLTGQPAGNHTYGFTVTGGPPGTVTATVTATVVG